MIEVQSLRKSFGAKRALENLSFRASDGAITGLLGANGAGKTTCMRIMAGALQPTAGSVQVTGKLGALLDHIGLYGRLTVRENLRYFGELQGLSGTKLDARIDELLTRLNLRELAGQRANTLSLGQSTKVALGRVLVHQPKNLLLDEPTNGLDIPAVRALRTQLRQLRDAGACIVFSSHVLDEIRVLCDSILMIAGGRVVACGTGEEICHAAGTPSLEDAFVRLTETEVAAHG